MTAKLSDNIVSPLGFSTAENVSAVLAGRTGVKTWEGAFGIHEPFGASLFNREEVLEEALGEGISGYTFFDTVALLSATRAIRESGIDPSSPDTVFILSSIKGNIDRLESDPGAVPLWASAAKIAGRFNNPNTPIVVSNACISGLCALIHANRTLLSGRFRNAVVVGCEVQSRFIVSGFQSLKAVSAGPCKPFDADRCGLNTGEAAATMVISSQGPDDAWKLGAGAVRNDANHISGPSRTGEGSYNCLRSVLNHCTPEELALISVHGTSTPYNDEMESIALSRAGLSEIPVCALKGCFGHTMGAAGILETLVTMGALERGIIPATKGYSTPGTSHPVNVSPFNRTTGKKAFIKLLSGFGGCNAAMLFRKGGES